MNPQQARMIIEQLLSMPIPWASKDVLDNKKFLDEVALVLLSALPINVLCNKQSIDDTLLGVLNQMIKDEQESSQISNRLSALQVLYVCIKNLSDVLYYGGRSPLKIEDFYRDAPGKFDLRWPLKSSLSLLPAPFDELDRKTQFYALFTEWQSREMEGWDVLNKGQLDQAEKIFQECVKRAEQIEVRELIARSYEGLMSVAHKRGDGKSELEWSKKAMKARSG